MPGGYVQLVTIIGLYILLVLWPPRRPRALAFALFFVSHLVNELPGLALGALLAGTVLALIGGGLGSTGGVLALGLAALSAFGLLEVIRRGLMTSLVVERSLDQELGRGWRSLVRPAGQSRWLRLARELLTPLPFCPRRVQRIRNVAYGDAGRRNRLDVYRRRDSGGGGPVLIHFHGGHFQMGGKSREALPLLHTLASRGWVCISANYRLRAPGTFPNSLIDAKRAISWARAHAAEYGADPSMLIVAGSSAGAHLAAMAALTPNEPAFQPGFEAADTAVSAAVCLYGYYGDREAAGTLPSGPEAYIGCDAPPFLVAHGDSDTLIPIDDADHFVQRLRAGSTRPVIYLRLPRAQHSFDLFHSPRFDAVIDGIEAFAAWERGNRHHTANGEQPIAPMSATTTHPIAGFTSP
jgi:acetyl esterase/lipase